MPKNRYPKLVILAMFCLILHNCKPGNTTIAQSNGSQNDTSKTTAQIPREALKLPTYQLSLLRGRNLTGIQAEGIFIKINRTEMRVNGRAGCNLFNGPLLETSEGNLSVGLLATTRMSCVRLTLESEILEAFKEATHFTEKDNKLVFVNGPRQLMVWQLLPNR